MWRPRLLKERAFPARPVGRGLAVGSQELRGQRAFVKPRALPKSHWKIVGLVSTSMGPSRVRIQMVGNEQGRPKR